MSKVKRAVILHAMEQTSQGHWYPWLKDQLEQRGYEVWVPDLPNNFYPSVEEAKELLLSSGWDFTDNLIIGHSSGSLQALYLVQNLPKDVVIDSLVLVSTFDHALPGMEEQHQNLFCVDYDSKQIIKHLKCRAVIHAKDDPWCPVEGAQYWAKSLKARLVVFDSGGHFSTSLDPKYTQFPELIGVLEEDAIIPMLD